MIYDDMHFIIPACVWKVTRVTWLVSARWYDSQNQKVYFKQIIGH